MTTETNILQLNKTTLINRNISYKEITWNRTLTNNVYEMTKIICAK